MAAGAAISAQDRAHHGTVQRIQVHGKSLEGNLEVGIRWAATAPFDQYISNLRQYKAIAMDAGTKDQPIAGTVEKLDKILADYGIRQETLRATGLKTKREAVETGLRIVLRLSKQDEMRRFRGRLKWQGNLDAMRSDR